MLWTILKSSKSPFQSARYVTLHCISFSDLRGNWLTSCIVLSFKLFVWLISVFSSSLHFRDFFHMYFLRSLSYIPRPLVNQSLLLSYDVYPTLLTRSRPLVGQSPLLPLPLRSRQLVDQSLFLASCFARGNWLISLSSLPLASLEAIGGTVSFSQPLASLKAIFGPVSSKPIATLEAICGPVSPSYPHVSLEAICGPLHFFIFTPTDPGLP